MIIKFIFSEIGKQTTLQIYQLQFRYSYRKLVKNQIIFIIHCRTYYNQIRIKIHLKILFSTQIIQL